MELRPYQKKKIESIREENAHNELLKSRGIPTLDEVKRYFENAVRIKDCFGDVMSYLEMSEKGIYFWHGSYFADDLENKEFLLYCKPGGSVRQGYAEIIESKPTTQTIVDAEEKVTRATQTVFLFEGDDSGEQEAIYYHDQKYLNVTHDGNQLCMTVANWFKLVDLVGSVIVQEPAAQNK